MRQDLRALTQPSDRWDALGAQHLRSVVAHIADARVCVLDNERIRSRGDE